MRNNPGVPISLYQVAGIFNAAYDKACTAANMVSGFENCGIFLLNQEKFENMFAAASVTDIPEQSQTPTDGSGNQTISSEVVNVSEIPDVITVGGNIVVSQEGTSETPLSTVPVELGSLKPASETIGPVIETPRAAPPSDNHVFPQDIIPYPKVNIENEHVKRKKNKAKGGSKLGKAAIITSSPY